MSTSEAEIALKAKLERLSNLLHDLGPITHSVVGAEGHNRAKTSHAHFGNTYNSNDNNSPSRSPTSRNLFLGGSSSTSNSSPSSTPQSYSLPSPSKTIQLATTNLNLTKLSQYSDINETLLKAQKILAQKPKERNNTLDLNDNNNNNTNNRPNSPNSGSTQFPQSKDRNEVKERLEKMLSVGNATENFQALEKSIAIFFGRGGAKDHNSDDAVDLFMMDQDDDDGDDDESLHHKSMNENKRRLEASFNGKKSFLGNSSRTLSGSMLSPTQLKERQEKAKYLAEKQKHNEALFRRHHARCEAVTQAGVKIERVFSLIPLEDPREIHKF